MKSYFNKLFATALISLTFGGAAQAAPILFSENFDDYYGIQNALQPDTNLKVSYAGSLQRWWGQGGHAIHAVDLGGNNYAPSFIADNRITLNMPIAANIGGAGYTLSFDAAPSTYSVLWQATNQYDGLVVQVLRSDYSVLASQVIMPGAWVPGAHAQDMRHYSYTYQGDGTGDVYLSIFSLNTFTPRFGGAIDNVQVSGIPEPETYALFAIGLVGLAALRRRKK